MTMCSSYHNNLSVVVCTCNYVGRYVPDITLLWGDIGYSVPMTWARSHRESPKLSYIHTFTHPHLHTGQSFSWGHSCHIHFPYAGMPEWGRAHTRLNADTEVTIIRYSCVGIFTFPLMHYCAANMENNTDSRLCTLSSWWCYSWRKVIPLCVFCRFWIDIEHHKSE
jgi:hypothetical protein